MQSWKKNGKQWILVALVCIAASPLAAGVVYEIEVTDHDASPPSTESVQTSVEGKHLKMQIASGGQGSKGEMIFRGDRREMVVVDHNTESYFVMDKEAISQIAGQVNDATSMMQEALKNVPEDKRAMVEQMMKQKMPSAQKVQKRPESEVRETGERATKNGYPCVKYEVYREGRKVQELWVADWSDIEGGDDVVSVFNDMADFLREMMAAMPQMGDGEGGPEFDDNVFEHMKELGGFPVVTREFEGDSLDGETVLRSAKRQTIDPDAFEPPSRYKRQEMFKGR